MLVKHWSNVRRKRVNELAGRSFRLAKFCWQEQNKRISVENLSNRSKEVLVMIEEKEKCIETEGISRKRENKKKEKEKRKRRRRRKNVTSS